MLLYAFNSMSEEKTIYIFFVYDFQDLETVLFWGGSGSRNFFPRSRPGGEKLFGFFFELLTKRLKTL